MASSQSSSGFLPPCCITPGSPGLWYVWSIFLLFLHCLDFVGEEKKPQHPACPGRHFSLGLEPLGCWVLFTQGSGQRTLSWGDGGQRMFNSHAGVTNCALCVTWVSRTGSPEGGEAPGFSPVLCPDCGCPLQQDLLPFQSFLVPRGSLAMATLSQAPSGSPSCSLRADWGMGAAPPPWCCAGR